jgi:hypothetical protein
MGDSSLRSFCLTLSMLAMLAGAGGMVLSFWYLASSHPSDISAGQSGFVAGAILIGSSLLSLSLLASRGSRAGGVESALPDRSTESVTGQESTTPAGDIVRRW